MNMKRCIKCGLAKPSDEFYITRKCGEYRSRSCKACWSDKYFENREEISDRYRTTKDYSIYTIKYDNEVLYVGSTNNSTSRMRDYNTRPYNVKQPSHTRPIARFIREHIEKGTISNHFEIIVSGVPKEDLRELEQFYIDKYNTPLNARNTDGTLRDVREVIVR